jgi:VanZ family protein
MLNHKFCKLITIILFLFIGYIIYAADNGKSTIFFKLIDVLPFGDKIGHFFLFGLLTLLLNLALSFKSFKPLPILPLGSVIVSVLIIIEELSQVYFPNRTLDVKDLIADAFGVLIFTYIGFQIHNRSPYFKK